MNVAALLNMIERHAPLLMKAGDAGDGKFARAKIRAAEIRDRFQRGERRHAIASDLGCSKRLVDHYLQTPPPVRRR